MSGIRHHVVSADDAGLRLDRWFTNLFPGIGHGRLEKLLRTGQIRVDGRRAKSGYRLVAGQSVRLPPFDHQARDDRGGLRRRNPDRALALELAERIIHIDSEILAIDKPPGLPVQGGTGSPRHVDGALDGLRFGHVAVPKLVHRLDKDTSGVLLLARSARSARWLTAQFRHDAIEKTYWALVSGVPDRANLTVDVPIGKVARGSGQRMEPVDEGGKRAITEIALIDQVGSAVAWIAVRPRTGRTHQIRVHVALLGIPILGDRKYGGDAAIPAIDGLSQDLHLHARMIRLKRPDGSVLELEAPLPPHMVRSWSFLGFDWRGPARPFAALDVAEKAR